jgi:hypothetical protein
MFRRALLAALAVILVMPAAQADEGMWTFDRVPVAAIKAAHGFAPSQAWLDHVRLSSVRVAGGCSSSFISPTGLVMTNHHCALECIAQLSTPTKNFVESGFYAKTTGEEVKCPGFQLDNLIGITDVTTQVLAATKGLSGSAYNDAFKKVSADLQKACGLDKSIQCDVVSLYHGGVYDVYKYKRFTDVRLVFAPEFAVAQFGGDPDNFNFPRYDFDISLVRAYENDKPAATPQYLHWSQDGSKAGDLVFVSGHPGNTQRERTISQVEFSRDVSNPQGLTYLAEYRGVLEQYGTEGAEQSRDTKETLFYIENAYKEISGEQVALTDPAFFAKLVAKENALRAAVAKTPTLRGDVGLWDEMATVQVRKKQMEKIVAFEGGQAFQSQLLDYARLLVRAPVEKAKPNAQRLPEFTDARLVTLPEELLAPIPVYPGVEELNLKFSLTKMREALGADNAFVRDVLGKSSPADLAHQLVTGSKLADPAVRKALYDGGQAAIDASTDPMIRLAARIDAQTRAVRKQYEDEVSAPERKIAEQIAKAKFAVEGTSVYPDATFTLRLSYGVVEGFTDGNGNAVKPYTTIGGLFNRATGSDPFVLPPSWLAAQSALDMATPMNFSTDNDIIGGNSGSPVVNTKGEVVGLIFDGNIFSLGGNYGFDDRVNRSVAVDSRALLAGMKTVYKADRIVTEIEQAR